MTFRPPVTPEQVDRLVREALEADARTVDVRELQASILEQLADSRPVRLPLAPLPFARRRWLRWSMAAAAGLLVAALLGEQVLLAPRPASAYSLVSSARVALARGGDRCYHVEQITVPRDWRPLLQAGDQTTVWTRGDRFHVITRRGERQLVWGQDEQERFWGVIDRERGLLYQRRELPAAARESLACLNLDARRITEEILTDFELVTEPASGGTILIRATLKAKPRWKHHFTSVLLDIEPETMIIRRMDVTRTVGAKDTARLSFTLVDERTMSDDHYRLTGNLAADAEIFDRRRATERHLLFMSQIAR